MMSDLIERWRNARERYVALEMKTVGNQMVRRIEGLEAIREAHVDEIYELKAENEMLTAENRTLRNVGITQQETIERLRARVEVLEGALMRYAKQQKIIT